MAKKLIELLTEYRSNHRQTMFGIDLIKPVDHSQAVPVNVSEKWRVVESPTRLRKKFNFADPSLRNKFVNEVLEYELHCEHYCVIKTSKNTAVISLKTQVIDTVTEIDQDFAKHLDVIYDDIIFGAKLAQDY